MAQTPLSKPEFDAKQSELEAYIRSWVERECVSFDTAVRRAAGVEEGGGSLWDVPAIDSKRTVSLLVELEPIVGRKLPSSLIKRGGYATHDEVTRHLLPKIRDLCSDVSKPGLAATTPSQSPSQVLP